MRNRVSSKSQLFLMEFICVLMFFSLSAAICISAFVKADNISKKGYELNEALIIAQSTAETIKVIEYPSHNKIMMEVEKINKYSNNKYFVKVKDKEFENMLQAEIFVYDARDRKREICNILIEKYLPSEVQNEE